MIATTFSVIIPTKDRHQDLQECLISITKQTIKPMEIIIIDASSITTDHSGYPDNINIVHEKAIKAGLPSQRNQGLDLLSPHSEFVFFLDDDVILEPNFFENTLKIFQSNKNIAGVGGVISNYNLPIFYDMILRFFLMRSGRPGKFSPSGYVTVPTSDSLSGPIESQFLPGGLSCYKVKVIKGLNFDTEYEKFTGHAYCEDLDFSYKVSQKGELIITPFARAIHKESPTARSSNVNHGTAQIVNRARLVKKIWGSHPFYWLCFSWAILGQIILNTAMSLKNWRLIKRVWGNILGVKYILNKFEEL